MQYELKLSIGYPLADRTNEIDIEDYYDLETWESFTEDEKDKKLRELAKEMFEDEIEYSWKSVKSWKK